MKKMFKTGLLFAFLLPFFANGQTWVNGTIWRLSTTGQIRYLQGANLDTLVKLQQNSLQNLDMLRYNSATGKFIPRTPAQVLSDIGGASATTPFSLSAIGSSPNANGSTLSAGTFNLQPASNSFGGAITTADQILGNGNKSFVRNLTINSLTFGKGNLNDSTNTAGGYQPLWLNSSGQYATALGYYALHSNSTGSFNTGIGYFSLQGNNTGERNTAIGPLALYVNTTGSYNFAAGVESMASNTTGGSNTAVGPYDVMYNNIDGTSNVAFGYAALYSNIHGNENTVGGKDAGYFTLGSDNTFLGLRAGYKNTTGNGNISIGYFAGDSTQAGSNNTYIGNLTGHHQIGSGNIAIGNGAVNLSNTADNQLSIGNTIYGNLSTGDITFKRYVLLPNLQAGTPTTDSILVIKSDNTIGRIAGNSYLTSSSGVSSITGTANQITASASTGAVTLSLPATINVNTSGNAATVTTNANLTGAITSSGNATSLGSFSSANLRTSLTDESGTGAALFAGGDIGSATGTSLTTSGLIQTGAGTSNLVPTNLKYLYNADNTVSSVAAITNNKAIYLRNDGSNLKLDAFDYNTSTALPVTIAGNGGATTIGGTLGINGTADNVKGGTYTPTFNNVSNVGSCTPVAVSYIRIGNTVNVTGVVPIAPTSTGSTSFRLSLPVASNLANYNDLAGPVQSTTVITAGQVTADTANDDALIAVTLSSSAPCNITFSFNYQIK